MTPQSAPQANPQANPGIKGSTVLIMAGGTGGHVFPGLATAQALQEKGMHIHWLGTRKGIEAELVARAGIPISFIKISGLRGTGKLSVLLAPFKLLLAVLQALRVIHKLQPACVLGMGGFASGPGGLAAWLLRKPLVIHEQNAVAGMTNKWLSRGANRVLAAFPGAFGNSKGVLHVGNPLRGAIVDSPEPAARMKARAGKIRLLVLGGSLGAQALNEVLPQALAKIPASERPEIWHQAGKRTLDVAEKAYQQQQVDARVEAFIDDMAAAYQWADVVLCRAGALTVSEIACVGVAAIFVPFPHAVDDHQTGNARFLERTGAAVIIPQHKLTAVSLATLLQNEFSDRKQILSRAEKARALANRDAAQAVAAHCVELCHV